MSGGIAGKLAKGLELEKMLVDSIWSGLGDFKGVVEDVSDIISSEVGKCHEGLVRRLLEQRILVHPPVSGETCGPLIVYKDNFMRSGEPASLGTGYLTLHPQTTSWLLEKLASAGFKLLGRGNMHELGLGTTNVNPHTGTPVNPVAPGRITGGSSGGPAAAVATGEVYLGVGTDAAGSIRVPAAFTGVYGVKPVMDETSDADFYTVMPSLETAGFLAKTPLHVVPPLYLAGLIELEEVLQAYKKLATRKATIGVFKFTRRISEEVSEAYHRVLALLDEAGLTYRVIPEGRLAWFMAAERLRAIIALREAYLSLYREYRVFSDVMGDDIRLILDLGSRIDHALYMEARGMLGRVRRLARLLLGEYDLVLLPTVPRDAPKLDEVTPELSASSTFTWLTGPFNVLDLPAASVPIWSVRLPSGIPFPLQLASASSTGALVGYSILLYKFLNK
ncbi:MAG: amidase [Desulfurococcales archaeon]|nr:amidase [Desulfurococcales archaeon]